MTGTMAKEQRLGKQLGGGQGRPEERVEKAMGKSSAWERQGEGDGEELCLGQAKGSENVG